MQVDDKLAKEKLELEISNLIQKMVDDKEHPCGADFWFLEITKLEEAIELIRNTDLTDCQQQGKWCNYCRKDNHNDSECWSTRPVNWKPEGLVNVFGNPIAPAPDQGSVRNATVPLDPTPEMLKAGAEMFYSTLHSAAGMEHHAAHVYRAMVDAAIRALPDQKD